MSPRIRDWKGTVSSEPTRSPAIYFGERVSAKKIFSLVETMVEPFDDVAYAWLEGWCEAVVHASAWLFYSRMKF